MTSNVASITDHEEQTVIGISFGNSNSSIGYTTPEGRPEVIANEDGDRQIPSILSYVDGEEFYGQQAKQYLIRNNDNTVVYFRDLLGKDYKEIDISHSQTSAHPQEHQSTIAFKIRDKECGEESIVCISEIVTRQIRRLVNSASDYIGKPVNAAVITIPTNFSDRQREDLIKAANNAGIDVLQLIHDPIAAILAYDSQPDTELTDKNVLVADFGGTRSDVSVVASRRGIYTILATSHDTNFAGIHLDQVLMNHFANEVIKKHGKEADPRNNSRSLAKLRLESEATKKALSIGTNASFSVESLISGIDFSTTINRLRYETIARKVFQGFNELVINAVKKAGLDTLDINEVILSGGTSHTPRIATNFRDIFSSPKTSILAPTTSGVAINPSELQVRGATLQASLIRKYEKDEIKNFTGSALTTAQHLSKAVGVLSISDDCNKGVFIPIIYAETSVPVRRGIQIATPREGGDVLVKIVEADSHIKVTNPKIQKKPIERELFDDNSDGDNDIEEEEEEVITQKVWIVTKVLAEAAIKDVKKGGKIDITITISSDLKLTLICREHGTGSSVQGEVSAT